ncbi:N-acetylglucosamine-1-phosphate uridyltransferase / Glucosamine-1-phosphate N-acetyltransferase [hydrothermal vent metagenome]|uniref:UDP-N-acetylglucosamine diphosphorylase n=1 Tax=hydrothermal vent metagenome TaxID=652676 RepID=A0A3B1CQH3_9ZZZZ
MNRRGAVAVVILAGGKGTRMKSNLPKVLHTLAGKPLLEHVLKIARALDPEKIVVIVGHRREMIIERFKDEDIEFAVQEPQFGTGHAMAQAEDHFKGFAGMIITLSGDAPLLKPDTLKQMIKTHKESGAVITMLTCKLSDPASYGRVIRVEGEIRANIEAKDATEDQLSINEINSGIYVFDADFLFRALKAVDNHNAQGEYYLTDLISIAVKKGLKVSGVIAKDVCETMGVNTAEELESLEKKGILNSGGR